MNSKLMFTGRIQKEFQNYANQCNIISDNRTDTVFKPNKSETCLHYILPI